MPLGTKYLHLCRDWMLSINFDQTRKISFSNKHVSFFFLLIKIVQEFVCFQVLLQPKARCILTLPLTLSHLQRTLEFFFLLLSISGVDTFESSSRLQHGFFYKAETIVQMPSLMTVLKSTNVSHNTHILKVFCFC